MTSHPSSQDRWARLWWALTGLFALGALSFAALTHCDSDTAPELHPAATPVRPPESAPARDTDSRGIAAEAVPPTGARPSSPPTPAAEDSPPLGVTPKEDRASFRACKSKRDCWGAKMPDCVHFDCENGSCTYDREHCECQTDAECDDGRACTRDVCFSRTNKCIHVEQDC